MENQRIAVSRIREVCEAALARHGASPEQAGPTATALAQAEAEGNSICGLFYLPHFCAHLQSGKLDGQAVPQVTRDGAVVRVDAAFGFVHPAFVAGLPALLAAVAATGLGAMSIANSYNSLAIGHYVRALAGQGLIGIAVSNSPATVAPPGATRPLYGTNPLAWAVPRAGQNPILADQSMSAVTRTEVLRRAADGRVLEPGWAQDQAGQPTLDARAALAGAILPAGGQRGANIALLIEILSAALSGGALSTGQTPLDAPEGGPPRVGQFMLALDPARFSPDHGARIEDLAETLAGAGVRLPGANWTLADAVPVPAALWQEALSLAGETGG